MDASSSIKVDDDHPTICITNDGPTFTQQDFEQLMADENSNKGLSGLRASTCG